MSDLYSGLYDEEVIAAYMDIKPYVDIPIELFVSEYWNKGDSDNYLSHAHKARTSPYAEEDNKIEAHRRNMERIAVAKISTMLADSSHAECKNMMRNTGMIQNSVITTLATFSGCRDPIAFLKSHGIDNPAREHLKMCEDISAGISAVWGTYKKKQINSHNPEKFRKHFLKNLKDQELVSEFRERKAQPKATDVPRLSAKSNYEDIPTLRRSVASADMPPLRKIADVPSDMPALRKISSVSDDMPTLRKVTPRVSDDMPALRKTKALSDDMPPLVRKTVNSTMPPLRPLVSAEKLEDEDDDLPTLRVQVSQRKESDLPILRSAPRGLQKVGDAKPLSVGVNNARRRIGSRGVRDSSVDMPTLRTAAQTQTENVPSLTAVGWMEKYIQKHKRTLAAKNYIYFAPSNDRTEKVLRSLERINQAKAFNSETFVKNHLCEDTAVGKDINNKAFNPIRDQESHMIIIDAKKNIKSPRVTNPEVRADRTVVVDGISVRVFVHDNILDFSS